MPLHEWKRVPSGLFHDFHQSWCVRIKDTLNSGLLPRGVEALVEQRTGPRESDVLALESRQIVADKDHGALAVAEQPQTHFVRRTDKNFYADRANRVVLRHHLGRILAVIEIVSPGNKDSRTAIRHFVEQTIECLQGGIHVLVIDLFPPTQRDPFGIHKVIWDEFDEEPFVAPPGKDRILISYKTSLERVAYIEPVSIGDSLPEMPLFLSNQLHVLVPLEPTYMATWQASPEGFRSAVETGVLPQPDSD